MEKNYYARCVIVPTNNKGALEFKRVYKFNGTIEPSWLTTRLYVDGDKTHVCSNFEEVHEDVYWTQHADEEMKQLIV